MKAKPIIRPCPECGRDYEYRRASGRLFELCEHCRKPNCVICGKKVPIERGYKNTCCVACEKLKVKNIQNVSYAKRFAEDSELNKKNHARKKELLLSDPEKMAKAREKERIRSKERMQNPEYATSRKAYHAERYAKNKGEIQLKRRERFSQLPDDVKAEKLEERAEYHKKYYQSKITKLKQNPESYKQYRDKRSKSIKALKNRKALAQLQKQITEVLNADSKKS